MKQPNAVFRLLIYGCIMCCPGMVLSQPVPVDADVKMNFFTYHSADSTTVNSAINRAVLLKSNSPDSALRVLQLALRRSRELVYIDGIMSATAKIAGIYEGQALFEKAIEQYKEALKFCDTGSHSKKYLAAIYNDIGNAKMRIGSLEQAAAYYYTGARFAARIPGSTVPAEIIYTNLLTVYNTLGQFEQAHYYAGRAEAAFRKDEKSRGWLGTLLINKGSLLVNERLYTEAKLVLKEALVIGRQVKNPVTEITALNNLADIYLTENDADAAMALLVQADKVAGDIPIYTKVSLLLTIGQAHYLKGNYPDAEIYLKNASSLAAEGKIYDALLASLDKLAAVAARRGRSEEALSYYQSYMNAKDSIQGKEIARSISQLEIKYRTAEKDKELISKQYLITRQQRSLEHKNMLLLGIAIVCLMLLMLFITALKSYRNKQRLLIQQQQITQLTAIMKGEENERSRISRELHDGIGGMLAAIKMNLSSVTKKYHELSVIRELDTVSEMLQQTSAEVRKTAHNLMPEALGNHSLEEALFHYCNLINGTSQLQLDLQVYGDLEPLNKSTAVTLYRIVQEILQNIIKHAEATRAEIQIMQYDETFSITVEDNGKGFGDSIQEGLGFQNLRYRVAALNGYLSITSAPGKNTTVHIELAVGQLRLTDELIKA
jgi:signal transduction histidine kinase